MCEMCPHSCKFPPATEPVTHGNGKCLIQDSWFHGWQLARKGWGKYPATCVTCTYSFKLVALGTWWSVLPSQLSARVWEHSIKHKTQNIIIVKEKHKEEEGIYIIVPLKTCSLCFLHRGLCIFIFHKTPQIIYLNTVLCPLLGAVIE